jgi:sulfur carrier protein
MITINGASIIEIVVTPEMTVASLLNHLGIEGGQKGIAVAVNDEVVPRSQWSAHELADGDRVEIIRATQGG